MNEVELLLGIGNAILIIIAAVIFAVNLFVGIKGYKKYNTVMAFYWFAIGFWFVSGIVGIIIEKSNISDGTKLLFMTVIGIIAGLFIRKLGKVNPLNNVCFGFISGSTLIVGLLFKEYFPTSFSDALYMIARYFRQSPNYLKVLPYIGGGAMIFFAFIKQRMFRVLATSSTGAYMCSLMFCLVFDLLEYFTLFYIIMAALFMYFQIKGIMEGGETNPFSIYGSARGIQEDYRNFGRAEYENFKKSEHANIERKEYKSSEENNIIKFCPKCGKRLGENVKFCPGCGNKIREIK